MGHKLYTTGYIMGELSKSLGVIMARDGRTEFEVLLGLSSAHIPTLVEYANDARDTAAAAFTSDLKRFGTPEKVEEWLAEERLVYTLVQRGSSRYSGILWLREEMMKHVSGVHPDVDVKNYKNTFAIRVHGEDTRGQGLAVPFMRLAIPDYIAERRARNANENIWLATSVGNRPAVHVYEKFGYEHASIDHEPTGDLEKDANTKIYMIYNAGLAA